MRGGALLNVYPAAAEQRYFSHKTVNMIFTLPGRQQAQAKLIPQSIPYAASRA